MTPRARARAAAILWLFRGGSALLLAYPVARTVGAFLPPAFPNSDALLFAPGGFYAVEAFRLGGRAIQASLEGSALGFVLIAIVASFPFAVALSALVRPAQSLPSLVKRGAECTPSLVALGGATALAQGIGIAAIAGLVGGLSGSFEAMMDERRSDLLIAAIASICFLPVVALGLAHDLARAAVVRYGVRSVVAARLSLRKLVRAPSTVLMSWLLPAFAQVVLVLVVGWAAEAIDVSRPGTGRVWLIAVLHQTTILGLVMLRLVWLERALALVDPPSFPGGHAAETVSEPPQALLAGTAVRSAAPGGPTPDPTA